VPNFAQLKMSDPAKVLPGYDYDVITADALLTRATVRDGRIVLPDGMSYRVLVLPDRAAISLPVLRKVKELVEAGATVVGTRPADATGLMDFPQSDTEVTRLANDLWGPVKGVGGNEHQVGRGRVVSGKTARDVLLTAGVKPDFDYVAEHADAMLDFIHRTDGNAEIYFVANRSNRWESARCTFRVSARAPELWDAVSGQRRFAPAYQEWDGRITLQLDFAPCGSWFVVFRQPASAHPAIAQSNTPQFESRGELDGPWTVRFDPKWGEPASVQFAELTSWPKRPEPGIKFFSGTATYAKTFDLPAALRDSAQPLWLDLGNLRELAEVRLNGKSLGILWTPPFRVDITDVVKATGNQLEVGVVNFWPNRIIGDQSLPENERRTRTNVRKLTKDTPLMESGLLGPVRLMSSR
jgi:hypothetical protein